MLQLTTSLWKKVVVPLLMSFVVGSLSAQHLASVDDAPPLLHPAYQDENVMLQDFLLKLEKEYQVQFAYNAELVNDKTVKASPQRGRSLETVLNQALRVHALQYQKIGERLYVIKPGKTIEKLENNNRPQEASLKKLNSLNSIKFKVQAVEQTISGQVTDGDTGEPLPGVNVLAKGTTQGTVTDVEGSYRLTVNDDVRALVFSSIGFMSQEVAINNRNVIDITMAPDVQSLEEVVVIGYGAVEKSDLTGSVSSVQAEELTAYPAIDAVQALQGRAAGVQITANNGEPGAGYKVRIRGGTSINASSDPIYVVDGFVGGAVPPPEDIASIEVLKDASATAIYGSRGANGVIIVTTKRGESGQTNIDLNVSYSLQNEINRLDLLNADQFADYIQDTNPDFTPLGANTDWQDEIFQTGSIQNYQLGISGGADNVKYYLSGTYFDQEGVIINSNYKRYSVVSNIDLSPSEKFRFGLNLFARRTNQEGVRTQEGSGGANGSGVVSAAFKFGPDQPIRDQNGNYTLARLNDQHDNAVAVAREFTNERIVDRFQGNLYGEYNIFDNLQFRTTLGASSDNGRTGQYTPTSLQGGVGVGGDGRLDGFKNSLLLNENYLTYSNEFGIHDLTVVGGYSYQYSRSESWGGRGQSFPTDAGLYWDLDASSVWQSPNSRLTDWELASWFGRLNYTLADRYLFTFNARYDGSSVFSEGQKWGFFPSGAFAWNMKEEAFMDNLDVVSFWKWRVSYGLTGNRAIAPYQTLAALQPVLSVQDGEPVNAVAPTSVANNNLTWETTAQFDVGLDIGLLQDRINLTMDYYRMVTSDLLFRVPLPEYSGYNTQLKNIGQVENKGFELTLNSRNLTGAFKWNMEVNFSINRNQILKLPDGNDILYRAGPGHMVGLGDTQILREGEPVGVFFGFVYDGVYQDGENILPGGGFEQEAGGEKFRDIDGIRDAEGELTGEPDGQLNNDDRTIIGDPQPDFIWGLNNNFQWKGFDLNVFFQASQGNDIYSFTLMELDMLAGLNNATTAALDRWTPTNTDTDVPAARGGRTRRVSSRWVRDGSFIRLKNLSLGYNLPQYIVEKANLRNLRVYVSAQNLLTFTNYEGYDPEVNYRTGGSTNSNRNLGLDYASYPNARAYTFGLNIGF